ncbi:hypothetical protein CLIB1423_42S00518 [[Candida] railenensis]|uniref:Uncharacterized protein n=1 Tax=[Candida] railenensis TaxID=45579 RepID=A0A9P0W1G0_9ASCO|nr:hypothetical protein CLIB1423_42S00518 [[Candida] railenensis]
MSSDSELGISADNTQEVAPSFFETDDKIDSKAGGESDKQEVESEELSDLPRRVSIVPTDTSINPVIGGESKSKESVEGHDSTDHSRRLSAVHTEPTQDTTEPEVATIHTSQENALENTTSVDQNANKYDETSDSDSDYVVDPQSISRSSVKSKVPGRLIERLWSPLSLDSIDSIQRILSMCVNQSIQRYAPAPVKGSSKKALEPPKKMLEAQKVLRDGWLSSRNTSSFASRLKETSLPLPTTKSSSSFGYKGTGGGDTFNYDKLVRRKKYLETYLSAELKQLNELEKNFKSYENVLEQDKTYLSELRRSTTKENSKMRNEISKKRSLLSIDGPIDKGSECRIIKKRKSESKFNPNEDEDTAGMLELLSRHLSSIKGNTSQLRELNTEIEALFNLLDEQ